MLFTISQCVPTVVALCGGSDIGVGTGGGGPGGPGPPNFTLETLLKFIHVVQIAAITVYITFGPPKMELLPTPMSEVHWLHTDCTHLYICTEIYQLYSTDTCCQDFREF